jgi:hypothetical protein
LKNVVDEIEELKKGKRRYTNERIKQCEVSNEMKTNFIFVFTLLITAKSINQFSQVLKHAHNVYCSEFAEDYVLNSLNSLREECLNRDLNKSKNCLNYSGNEDKNELNRQNMLILEEFQEKVNFIFPY